MRQVKASGRFRSNASQIQVNKVWTNPLPPFKATVISVFDVEDYYEDEQINGSVKKVRPFGEARQRTSKVFVDLKPSANSM